MSILTTYENFENLNIFCLRLRTNFPAKYFLIFKLKSYLLLDKLNTVLSVNKGLYHFIPINTTADRY